MANNRSRHRARKLPDPEDDPDFINPKGFIMTRALPEQYGADRRTQLKNRLVSAGFLRVKVDRVIEHDDTAWVVSMYADSKSEKPMRDMVYLCLNAAAKDLGFSIQRGSVVIVARGRKIEASFVIKPLTHV